MTGFRNGILNLDTLRYPGEGKSTATSLPPSNGFLVVAVINFKTSPIPIPTNFVTSPNVMARFYLEDSGSVRKRARSRGLAQPDVLDTLPAENDEPPDPFSVVGVGEGLLRLLLILFLSSVALIF